MAGTSGFYTDLYDARWAIAAPLPPPAKPGGRPRTTCLRGLLHGVFYLLRAGCQWRLLPRCFPPWGTVCDHFRLWQRTGLRVRLHRAVYASARASAGRPPCPSLVIMDGQSVKTTERGGARGFDGHELIRGRKRHILVDTLGLPIASRVEPANMPDQKASARLLGGLRPRFLAIRTVVADAGHRSRKPARDLPRHEGWRLRIVLRRERAFRITGLTWIVERSFAWPGRNRRLSGTVKLSEGWRAVPYPVSARNELSGCQVALCRSSVSG